MHRLIIFGGTTEGRRICQWCTKQGIDFLYCTATDLGVEQLDTNRVRVGRIKVKEMREFLKEEAPELVIDATHPYADKVSAHIAAACSAEGIERLSVLRQASDTSGCEIFLNEDSLIAWLTSKSGVIFSATGVKEAALFTRLPDFKERVWFRLLPTLEGLKTCLEAGYPREHLILMWGPFSDELNKAMFAAVGASILVTKDSGHEGGFPQKKKAALERGMQIAVMQRPLQETGFSCNEAILEIEKKLGLRL
ncbi:MAG: precorrin-6A reductase [Treponema sp.]|jgi:precorrin-6x reductase|nr:precorrin-6A reductase [Treponema sp.]